MYRAAFILLPLLTDNIVGTVAKSNILKRISPLLLPNEHLDSTSPTYEQYGAEKEGTLSVLHGTGKDGNQNTLNNINLRNTENYFNNGKIHERNFYEDQIEGNPKNIDQVKEEKEVVSDEIPNVRTRRSGPALMKMLKFLFVKTSTKAPSDRDRTRASEGDRTGGSDLDRTGGSDRDSTGTSFRVMTEPSEGVMTEPSDRVMTEPSDGVITEPSDGDMTEPSHGLMTEPSDGDMTEPSDGVMTEPSDRVMTEPSDGVITEPSDGDMTEPSDGLMTEPSDGYMTEPSDGVMTEPSDGLMTEPSDTTPSSIPRHKFTQKEIDIERDEMQKQREYINELECKLDNTLKKIYEILSADISNSENDQSFIIVKIPLTFNDVFRKDHRSKREVTEQQHGKKTILQRREYLLVKNNNDLYMA